MKEEPCLDAVQHDELAPGDHQPGPGHDRGVQAVHHPLPPGHLLRHPPGLLPGHRGEQEAGGGVLQAMLLIYFYHFSIAKIFSRINYF